MIKLTIDRNRWARGGKNGEAMLLNGDSNMCCLGFACRAVGLTAEEIEAHGTPDDLINHGSTSPETIDQFVVATNLTCGGRPVYRDNPTVLDAISVNDNSDITDEEREAKLIPILAKLGFDAEFVDE